MKCNEYICDICGKHKEVTSFHAIERAKRYWWQPEIVPEQYDICNGCLKEIRNKVQNYDE